MNNLSKRQVAIIYRSICASWRHGLIKNDTVKWFDSGWFRFLNRDVCECPIAAFVFTFKINLYFHGLTSFPVGGLQPFNVVTLKFLLQNHSIRMGKGFYIFQ